MNNLRYLRQIAIPAFGIKGQKKLSNSRVAVIGAGGIGCGALAYLAAAGVGKIILVEKDNLEISNLNRQILYKEKDLGLKKAALAADFLKKLNSEVKIEKIASSAGKDSLLKIFKKCDLLLDCSDNFDTRFAVNSAALEAKKPYIFAAVYRSEAQVAFLEPAKGPCLRCLFCGDLKDNQNCSDYGIFGPVAGAAGCMASLKAIEFLSEMEMKKNEMFFVDFSKGTSFSIKIKKNKKCLECLGKKKIKDKKFYFLKGKKEVFLVMDEKLLNAKKKNKNLFHISLEELSSAAFFLDKKARIFISCKNGIKSSLAFDKLKGLGFKQVRKI